MSANRPIVIKKVKKFAGGHHGGAWKVAYADFVTAMMAFFLLMWLINTTSPDQKRGIADYFAPASLSSSTSGSGGILAGTALGEKGAMQQGATPVIPSKKSQSTTSQGKSDDQQTGGQSDQGEQDNGASQAEYSDFMNAEVSIRQAMQELPELSDLSKNVIVDQTREGMRIQLIDQEGRPMFQPGSIELTEDAKTLLRTTARVILTLPNKIIIAGHTDSAPNPNPNYSNWELSAARANSARKLLKDAGIPDDRIAQISGKAGSEPLFPDDPYQASNRRITIVLEHSTPPIPQNVGL